MHGPLNVKAFRFFRKIAKSDYQLRYVCPSVLMEQLGFYWTILWNVIFEYISKIWRENSSSLKSFKNNGQFTRTPIYILTLPLSVRLRIKKFQKNFQRKLKHFLLRNGSFNRDIYETMRKNVVERGRPQLTIWSMRIVCWITEATNTHSDYVIIITLPLQQCLHKRPSMLLDIYIDFPVFIVSNISPRGFLIVCSIQS